MREANQQIIALQARIESVNAELNRNAAQENLQLASTLSGAELRFMDLCRSALVEQRAGLEKRLATTSMVRDSRRAAFRQARQECEVIETLRHTQAQVYHRLEDRQNQRQLDDLLLLRRAYLLRK